jgi:hypothetical protein
MLRKVYPLLTVFTLNSFNALADESGYVKGIAKDTQGAWSCGFDGMHVKADHDAQQQCAPLEAVRLTDYEEEFYIDWGGTCHLEVSAMYNCK